MALDADLVIVGAADPGSVLERAWLALPTRAPVERLDNGALVADLFASYGFALSAFASKHGYVDANADGTMWEWELAQHVVLGFRFRKEFDMGVSRAAMLRIVARILATGNEDVVLAFNSDVLLLRRLNGRLERFEARGFWYTVDGELPPELST